MAQIKPHTLSGFMELLPQPQLQMEAIMEVLRRTYGLYGFTPLDTPVIEDAQILLAKGGGETEKQIYRFQKGDSDLALRFDLTVPLAKYVALHYGELSFPFRRYQIGKVYRGERAQRGRFREFYQADIDIIGDGKLSITNEAEIPSIIYRTFSTLGLRRFQIRVNNRKILNGFYAMLGLSEKAGDIMRTVDKLDKIGPDKVRTLLVDECGVEADKADEILRFIAIRGTNDEVLAALEQYRGDLDVLENLRAIKRKNKVRLAAYIAEHNGVNVDPDSIFDVQVKRLHEYKRQLLNVLYILTLYNEIKDHPEKPVFPQTFIFAAKASAGYYLAKQIISLIVAVSNLVNSDPQVQGKLKVVFIEDYKVSLAEIIIPAADLSEQISVAGKEASGTSNMKLMINGAVTLGTLDGANVEISQQVGNENIYIFGQTSGQVIHRYAAGDYNPADWYEGDPNLRRAIDFLTGPEMLAAGKEENLARLQHELKTKDWFQTLPDFNAYVVRKGQALSDYACDPLGWRRKCLINISKAGFFSSDRTIAEYNSDIWHLGE